MRPLLLALSLFACAEESPGLPLLPQEIAALPESAAAWRVYTYPERAPYCTANVDGGWCMVGGAWWRFRKVEDLYPPSLGSAHRKRKAFEVVENLTPEWFTASCVHELGHALGLEHTADGVMEAYMDDFAFTPSVLAECRRAGSCP